MRRVYDARRELLLRTLEKDFSRWLTAVPSTAGLHLTVHAHALVDVEALVESARAAEVGVRSLRAFQSTRLRKQGLCLGYGAIEESAIAEGLARLHRILARLRVPATSVARARETRR
jgi:GntR family transcriptional regulator/MocR family aminotransferase